ncbi:glutamate--tRNA ligase [Parenemella sanctibonifatiensis]|uniref:Glutamate--tRNA ligase n=2 Tax=Parenemella sanctibonifatiensis TaxID=2016505 RepID=A0A255EHS5_9ACTN|nr:glutamate--tRNA ligase [Parenemella sanctibonifatiensis]OYN89175.1 glutamate--tRNA ligase [Parenemella sanctibonifatiensis]
MTETPARLRVAPSPTGDPHVGTAYMSLFNLAYARKTGGQFVLRIEDTDRARYDATSEQQVYDTLTWLGLEWDEGPDKGGPYAPYRQSERLETYRPYVEQLIEAGHAYYCWCSSERLAQMREVQQKTKQPTGYDRLCYGKTREERAELPGFSETPVVRMYVPGDVSLFFDDLVRGRVSAPRPDDQVILKADGFPTYHMAVVVDDHLMGITHVARGEEWISSTPKHLLLYQWLGWEAPRFAHMPLLRNTDRSKISKRKNPAARLTWFIEQGYLPDALRNFLQLIGYPPVRENEEVASFDEFVASFDWAKVNTVGPVFDLDKLNWLNGHYIRQLSTDELTEVMVDYMLTHGDLEAATDEQRDRVRQAAPLVQERIQLLSEVEPMLGFLFWGDDEVEPDDEALKQLKENAAEVLSAGITALEGLETWTHEAIEAVLREKLVEGMGIKARFAFTPLRVGITGRRISPPLFESMEILGRDSSLRRLQRFSDSLQG